jgi:hypothetical protein
VETLRPAAIKDPLGIHVELVELTVCHDGGTRAKRVREFAAELRQPLAPGKAEGRSLGLGHSNDVSPLKRATDRGFRVAHLTRPKTLTTEHTEGTESGSNPI